MKAHVILNLNARKSDDQTGLIRQLLDDAGIDATIIVSDTPHEALQSLQDNERSTDAIIVGGGDGTLSALLPAILAARKPLGILPLGTANDFACSINLPDDLTEAVQIIAEGHTRDVDVAFANSKPFLNAVNVGLGERVAAEHGGALKSLLGKFAYPIRWWNAWRRNDPFAATVVIDHEHPVRFKAEQITVSNSEGFGGGVQLDEQDSVDSGKLSVAGMRPRGLLSWLNLTRKLAKGKINDTDHAGMMPVESVRIETQPRRLYTADGDHAGRTPVDISVQKQSLTVFAPA